MIEYTSQDVERLFVEDPLGNLGQKLESVHAQWEDRFKQYQHVSEAYHRIGSDSALRERIRAVGGFATEEGVTKSAEILCVSPEDLKAYLELGKQCNKAMAAAVDVPKLKEEWTRLLESAPLREVTLDTFPKEIKKPFIVLYTTGWCLPCQLLKPTFARLSFFFSRMPLYYSLDDGLMKKEGVGFIPQFVAYFPNGGKVYSSCGENTREVWNTMHRLVALGQGFEGKGRLECGKEECRIVEL